MTVAVWLETLAILTWLGVIFVERIQALRVMENWESTVVFISKYLGCGLIAILIAREVMPYLVGDFFRQSNAPKTAVMHLVSATLFFSILRSILRKHQEKLIWEQRFQEAQHAAFKAKFNPHFLFNTLNLISSAIDEKPDLGRTLLNELLQLLNGILHISARKSVALSEEIALLRHYLVLQKERFEHRLEYRLNIPDDCLKIPVPPLFLQPLVENAIVHGIAPQKEQGVITLEAFRTAAELHLIVHDNGVGYDTSQIAQGHGLSLVHDTLTLLFGKGTYRIEVESTLGQGTTIRLQLPAGEV